VTTETPEQADIQGAIPEFEKRIASLRQIADSFDSHEYQDGRPAIWAANLREIANWHESNLDKLRGLVDEPVVTDSETPVNSQSIDPDGLPLIDKETEHKWRQEALQNLPLPVEIAELMVRLRWNTELHKRELKNPDLPLNLTVCEQSVRAIIQFLNANNYAQEYECSIPFMLLNSAFVDIAYGKSSKLFKPRRRNGRPPNDVAYETAKGLAAKALSELIEAGENGDEAADRVARVLQKFRRDDIRKVSGRTVTNWRATLMQGPGPGASAAALFQYKTPLPANFGDTPKARGENLLNRLENRRALLGMIPTSRKGRVPTFA
jgi:hypothetical protein